ncbi:ORC-CDC6 family AAA ATPase [Winogradskyella luteola]|uniref:Uncharacterized protein n=1 Tax=Winogradskyella luteola TaxID=2828330 RepID=A0A9X1FBP9_9FLAO|nr:hypothetical protein [Winogradskyella luteola]MBV7270666.1 hypothetical protein [Winogradskyella luteola]
MNPFEVKTPEDLKAGEIHELFVDVFTDFGQVKEVFHTFLNGPRGSGKSMMFRYMMPDCQMLDKNCNLNELDYFSLYIPIKLTDINYPELGRLKNNSNTFINEHLLTTYIAIKCFKDLKAYDLSSYIADFEEFYNDVFLWYVEITGEDISSYKTKEESSIGYINKIIKILERMLLSCKRYCTSVATSPNSTAEYQGALCNYLDFLYPILLGLGKLSFMPREKPIFLLIDDAGYLNTIQTRILNTWVSYRNSAEVSLKISTQLDYKSFKTITNKTIDFPHDYSQINITTIYTSSNKKYYNRIESIVSKRIKKYLKKEIESELFFPQDEEQAAKIKEFYDKIEKEHTNPDKPYAGKDAARRYATSEYVKYLRKHRSGATYSYAGFDNLVNISSGIIRYFLEPASRMFSEYETQKGSSSDQIEFIPHSIQNEEIVKFSTKFLEDEFKKIFEEHGDVNGNEKLSKADKLYNLLEGLGGMFSKIFVSDRTERVVFSVALNDMPDKELKEIIELAISYGYLHQSSIGNKQGTGRSKLYILSRTLAPFFKLDPTGFKGYKFMNSSMLKLSLTEPQKFVKESTKYFDSKEDTGYTQVSLFDELE